MRAFFLFLLSLILLVTFSAHADNVADLQRQIDQRNANIKALEQEIAAYKQEVDKTSAKAKTLANAIKILETTGKKLDTDIKITQTKIGATTLTIKKLNGDIADKQARLETSKEGVAENIRLLNQFDAVPLTQNFLQSKNLAQVWVEASNILSFQDTIRSHMTDLRTIEENLAVDKKKNEEKKKDLSTFASTLTDQKKVVVQNKNEQNSLLKDTKNQEANYQKIIADKEKLKAAFEKELYDYEAKLKYTLDPKSLPPKGSAPFSWPTDDVYITQQFGVTNASGRLYASGSHNGIDLKALRGTPVHAIADGTVAGTGNTDLACPRASFGQWILVKHDNGLAATFAHLSVISVSPGQKVTRGQVIGYSGNTGYSTGPHLHISVYPNDGVSPQNRPSASCAGKTFYMPIAAVNAYLDPMLYFPKL
ncbi:MAG: peptidoglycan DD-metalloendopeptidase family protein [Candidatus Paceibacterota bacterium]|jgi:murein DD-endopeptidase MepM/ murein hydrolase activator NlpD